MDEEFLQKSRQLIEAGQYMHGKGWVPATSGNFSTKLSDGNIAITVSGRHKGRLSANDIMVVDSMGNPISNQKPSAETLLHVQIYRLLPNVVCVLHPHTIHATILSRFKKNQVILQDYELLKAFPGVDTHECSVNIPVFKNDQNIPRLAQKVETYLQSDSSAFGYLIEGHGFYTWGQSVDDCLKQVEAFEFLFQCEIIGMTL